MTQSATLRDFICAEFAPDLKPGELPADLDLIDSGIIDSLGVLKLVAFLEGRFDIAIAPEELDADLYRTIDSIEALIAGKRIGSAA